MKILFLCAGYGTRLEKDLKQSSEFPECIGRPKALLPIGDNALISFWSGCLILLHFRYSVSYYIVFFWEAEMSFDRDSCTRIQSKIRVGDDEEAATTTKKDEGEQILV